MTDEAKQAVETVSKLVADVRLFDSNGYSEIKVTKDGAVKQLRLPIKSTGVADFQEHLTAKAPRPPVRREFYKKGSPEALALGINHAVSVVEFDNTDEAYVDALEKHGQMVTWQVAVFAIDMPFERPDGTPAGSVEEKVEILKSSGMTAHHIQQVFDDVQALTQFSEDRQDFLSES